MTLPHRWDTAVLVGCTACFWTGFVGLLVNLAIPSKDWLLAGSGCLLGFGGSAALAYMQLQWQVVLVRKPHSWFKLRMELTEKSLRPRMYWISTVAYIAASLIMLAGAVSAFVVGTREIVQ